MAMCSYWLVKRAPRAIRQIELVFPVPGHSYIPPDRVFGQIEKKVKRHESIIDPEDYYKIYRDHGKVLLLGTEVKVFDWKTEALQYMKPPGNWHFQFNKAKRFYITKNRSNSTSVLIRGEPSYRCDTGSPKLVMKKGKSITLISPEELPVGVPVKKEKLDDVDKLLQKHYGTDWKTLELPGLEFYKKVSTLIDFSLV